MMSYAPVQPGIPKQHQNNVIYSEKSTSSPKLADYVYCIWQLKTISPLQTNFKYLVFPDCCIDLVIDLDETSDTVLAMTPGTRAISLQLGKSFHYLGVRILPGSWNGAGEQSATAIVASPEPIQISLTGIRAQIKMMRNSHFDEVAQLIEKVILDQDISFSPMPECVSQLLEGSSVLDTARYAGYSTRQLGRITRASTGFSPRELIRIGKMQRVIRDVQSNAYLEEYYDQPHFIREFKKICNYTPAQYNTLF